MNNFEFYTACPETMAQLLASAYIAGFDASRDFNSDEIDEMIWNEEFTRELKSLYLKVLNATHPTYLGKAD